MGTWAVLVCEVMSQQTPVARVVPRWSAWLERWPTPAALADAPAGDAVRMWDRLGYPRRALRLHEAATVVRDRYGGVVPATYEALLGLPGVGPYTAAATAAFAHGERVVVLDVNIRRVLARVHEGVDALPGAPTRAERGRALALLPEDPARSIRWNAAVMELGATVCTARVPHCVRCPLAHACAWVRDPGQGQPRARTTRPQAWLGSDRHVRGLLMAVLRAEAGTVPTARLEAVWGAVADAVGNAEGNAVGDAVGNAVGNAEGNAVEDAVGDAVGDGPGQTRRCLDGLVADGLAVPAPGGYRLPG